MPDCLAKTRGEEAEDRTNGAKILAIITLEKNVPLPNFFRAYRISR